MRSSTGNVDREVRVFGQRQNKTRAIIPQREPQGFWTGEVNATPHPTRGDG